MQRKRLRPKSRKRIELDKLRKKVVDEMLVVIPLCQACVPIFKETDGKYGSRRGRRSEHIHEIILRSDGGSIIDEANLLSVCPLCHHWIHHVSPKAALKIGLTKRNPKNQITPRANQ